MSRLDDMIDELDGQINDMNEVMIENKKKGLTLADYDLQAETADRTKTRKIAEAEAAQAAQTAQEENIPIQTALTTKAKETPTESESTGSLLSASDEVKPVEEKSIPPEEKPETTLMDLPQEWQKLSGEQLTSFLGFEPKLYDPMKLQFGEKTELKGEEKYVTVANQIINAGQEILTPELEAQNPGLKEFLDKLATMEYPEKVQALQEYQLPEDFKELSQEKMKEIFERPEVIEKLGEGFYDKFKKATEISQGRRATIEGERWPDPLAIYGTQEEIGKFPSYGVRFATYHKGKAGGIKRAREFYQEYRKGQEEKGF